MGKSAYREEIAMGKNIGLSFFLIFLLFFLPWLWGAPSLAENIPDAAADVETQTDADSDEDETEETEAGRDRNLLLNVLIGGDRKQMDMENYLQGVLRAEMPATFHDEALKAQAVAARTYTVYKICHGGSENHPDADVCDDSTCCQAYLSYEEASEKWGEESAANEAKIQAAVADTDGECVLYAGEPVLAVFHSSSVGTTQEAAAVWSEGLPYLQSVETPEDENTVPNYHSQASFSTAELKERLQTALPDAVLTGSPTNWFTNVQQQPNGTVTSLSVGGVDITGSKLRSILELRSACFTISFDSDTVIFSVTGYGHGVGMSQYGANVLASEGMGYKDILAWYYTGTDVDIYAVKNR